VINTSIIKAVERRDEKACQALYEQSIAYVYTVTSRYISNETDIPDIIQESYARLFLNIASFDPTRGAFKSWLRRIVINQCFQHYRQGKSPRLHVALDNAPPIADKELGLHELSKEEIESLLSKMPDGYQEVFMLVIIDEFKHSEVAQLLGISVEASRSQLSRAKKWIRKHLTNTTKTIVNGF
jgi:RNA polymerase sigma factor (sigma-70 family)